MAILPGKVRLLFDVLDSVESIPRIDTGVVAVGKRKLDRVVSDQFDVRDVDIVRHGIDVEGADSRPLIDATGATALTPKLSCVISARRGIAPIYFKRSLGSFQLDVSWRVAHVRVVQSELADASQPPLSRQVVSCIDEGTRIRRGNEI